MSKLLIETDQDIDPVDDSTLFYAKPLNIEKALGEIKAYLLAYGLHSGLNHAEGIGEKTAENIAGNILKLLHNVGG